MGRKRRKESQTKRNHKTERASYPHKPLRWQTIYTSKWFLPLVGVFVLTTLLSVRPITAIDIGFHLRGGQWILGNMAFHKNDVFTYTVNQNEYIAMYWLYQVLVYSLFTLTGYAGLSIMNAILIALVFFLMFIRMKSNGIPVWLATITLLLTTLAMETRFMIRPEVMTWILLIVTLLILDQYFHYKKNYLYLLPIIQLLWVNVHGLFILGWIATGTYLMSTWFHERKFDTGLCKWFIVSIMVSLANPYFLKGITFPFYLFTRLQGSSIFKDAIAEFKSPWTIKTTALRPFLPALSLYSYYLTTFASFILCLITYKKRKVHEYLILGAFFYISATAIRNVPLFIIVAIPLIAVSVRDIVHFRFPSKQAKIVTILFRYTPYVFLIFTALFSLRVITDAYYIADRRTKNFGTGLDKYTNPISAADFIVRNNLRARMLNDLNSGSWLIWTIPQPVFIDGRLEVMQETFFQEYLKSFEPGGLAQLIEEYKPKIILFDYFVALKWHIQLKRMPEWRLIYWDEKSVIYAHQGYAREWPAISFIDVVSQLGIDTAMSDADVWSVLKTPGQSKFAYWVEGFFKKQHRPVGLLKMGDFAYVNHEFRSAEFLYLAFLKITRGNFYEVHFNLGSLYYRSHDYKKMLYCYERILQEHPENTLAQQRVNEVRRK